MSCVFDPQLALTRAMAALVRMRFSSCGIVRMLETNSSSFWASLHSRDEALSWTTTWPPEGGQCLALLLLKHLSVSRGSLGAVFTLIGFRRLYALLVNLALRALALNHAARLTGGARRIRVDCLPRRILAFMNLRKSRGCKDNEGDEHGNRHEAHRCLQNVTTPSYMGALPRQSSPRRSAC